MPVAVDIKVDYLKKSEMPSQEFEKVRHVLEVYMRQVLKPQLKREMQRRVRNWKTPVHFAAVFSSGGDKLAQLTVFPRGEGRDLWMWVSLGTRARTITAKNKPMLVFREGYDPKTAPGNRFGGPGKRFGPLRIQKTAQYPGIEARLFEENILKHDVTEEMIIKRVERMISLVLTP